MEMITLVTGVIYIILEIRQKNAMWLVGIATSLAAMWVFFSQGLYASFGLNTYYLITAIIGLWQWRRDSLRLTACGDAEMQDASGDVIHLNRLTFRVAVVSLVVALAGIWGLSYLMTLLENPMSLLDASVAVISAVATWWLVRSYLEQWFLWIAANALTVVLCVSQGMWWMTLLYVAYVVSAVIGYLYWKKKGRYL